jgi:hypothetical protein
VVPLFSRHSIVTPIATMWQQLVLFAWTYQLWYNVFSHNKSANSTFGHDFSAKRTERDHWTPSKPSQHCPFLLIMKWVISVIIYVGPRLYHDFHEQLDHEGTNFPCHNYFFICIWIYRKKVHIFITPNWSYYKIYLWCILW